MLANVGIELVKARNDIRFAAVRTSGANRIQPEQTREDSELHRADR